MWLPKDSLLDKYAAIENGEYARLPCDRAPFKTSREQGATARPLGVHGFYVLDVAGLVKDQLGRFDRVLGILPDVARV